MERIDFFNFLRRRVRITLVCDSWIDAHGRRGCVCMCVLLWALTESAVHVLMFSSCFTAKLRISQRRRRRIAHPEQYFYVLSGKSEHFHPLKSATCARFNP